MWHRRMFCYLFFLTFLFLVMLWRMLLVIEMFHVVLHSAVLFRTWAPSKISVVNALPYFVADGASTLVGLCVTCDTSVFVLRSCCTAFILCSYMECVQHMCKRHRVDIARLAPIGSALGQLVRDSLRRVLPCAAMSCVFYSGLEAYAYNIRLYYY